MSETLPYIYKYPTDLSGLHPTNQIAGERMRVHRTFRGPYVGIPAYAPFFSHALVVLDENGVELVPERDYKAIYLNEELTNKSPYEVCSAVYITADLPNQDTPGYEHTVTINYRTVGYPYTHMVGTMAYLLEQLNNDQRPVQWGKVIDKPDGFRPEHHLHPAGDLFGFEHVVSQLEDIRKALTGVYAFNDPNNVPFTQMDRTALEQALGRANASVTRSQNSETKVDTLLADLAEVFAEDHFGQWLPGVVRLIGPSEITERTSHEYYFSGVPEGATVTIESELNPYLSKTSGIEGTETIYLISSPLQEGQYPITVYAERDGRRTMKRYQAVVVNHDG